MRVLLAISILAFLALLWASIAIFRHIRRAQRRRRRALEASASNLNPAPPDRLVIAPRPSAPIVPEITFTDPEAPLPEVTFTDPEAPIPAPTRPLYQPYSTSPPEVHQPVPAPPVSVVAYTPQPAPAATPIAIADTVPPPPAAPRDPVRSPVTPWPHFGFTPSRPVPQPDIVPPEEDDFRQWTPTPFPPPEPIPYAAPAESSASIAAVRAPIEIQPPSPAVRPIYPSAHPTVAEATPPAPPPISTTPQRPGGPAMRRADWAYFNKDMGDLSDPPPAGSRTRIPVFVPQPPAKPNSD